MKYEYIRYTDFKLSDNDLNLLGAEGWELVGWNGDNYIFKKEKL